MSEPTEMDLIYERMGDDLVALEKRPGIEESQIWNFYSGQTILLTGATGFMGKSLVEKLLRTCTGLEKIYAIIRPKKGKSSEDRLKKFFENELFDEVRQVNPNFAKKFIPIAGDLTIPGLGLSAADRQLLIEETTLVIHNGASVSFTATLSASLKCNVLATQQMLELAKDCKKIKAFMYVSTGFSQCHVNRIEEKCYPPPADLKIVQDIIRAETEAGELTPAATQQLIGQCVNSYIFTKATAEGLVEDFAKKASFPCGIFRPTVVVSTYNEPRVAWCDNFNGPVASTVAYAMGVLHFFPISDNPFNAIPLDLTNNALLAFLWHLVVFKESTQTCTVCNYCSNQYQPRSIKAMTSAVRYFKKQPPAKMIWLPWMSPVPYFHLYMILHYVFHILPGIFADVYFILKGRGPLIVPLAMKYNKNVSLIVHFAMSSWDIKTNLIEDIWKRMNHADHVNFFCDLRQFSWEEYLFYYWRGVRRYVLKDTQETIPAARRKYRIFWHIQYTLVAVFSFLFLRFLFKSLFQLYNAV